MRTIHPVFAVALLSTILSADAILDKADKLVYNVKGKGNTPAEFLVIRGYLRFLI